ncbi:hypothetical protein [Streptomyces virginiae]|uniref:hypothetical protein n=1 Tax=Streptomyces virginiae TaxID=1961 RepID=UPI0033269616
MVDQLGQVIAHLFGGLFGGVVVPGDLVAVLQPSDDLVMGLLDVLVGVLFVDQLDE